MYEEIYEKSPVRSTQMGESGQSTVLLRMACRCLNYGWFVLVPGRLDSEAVNHASRFECIHESYSEGSDIGLHR